MKDFLKHNWFKIGILLLVGIAIFGYFSLRSNELQAKANKEVQDKVTVQQEREDYRNKLDICLSSADTQYTLNWNSECTINSMDGKKEDCSLPNWDYKQLEEKRQIDKSNCFKQYPQN